MSTLLQSLKEQSSAVSDNYNANLTVNTLANLQETFAQVPGEIVFRAEMIPVSKFNLESGDLYCVEMEDFTRLKRSQNIDEETALNQIYEALRLEEGNDIEGIDEIAIVLEKEDIDALEKKVKENPDKVDAKCEAVTAYTNMLNRIIEAGVQIMYK